MGIIVRIPKDMVVSKDVEASLEALFQQKIKIKEYHSLPDQQANCLERMNSLHNAFLAITTAIPIGKKTDELLSYLDWCQYTSAVLPNLTIEQYQDILSRYTSLLIGAIHDYYLTPSEQKTDSYDKYSTRLLNKAEQYVIMQNGRDNLATVSLLPGPDGDKLIVQWDEQITPYLPETLDELNRINNSTLRVTPAWFRQLPSWQQLYLHSIPPYYESWDDFGENANRLLAEWLKVKNRITDNDVNLIKSLNSEDLKRLTKPDAAYLKDIAAELPNWFKFSHAESLAYHYQSVIKSLLSVMPKDEVNQALTQFKNDLFQLRHINTVDVKLLRGLPYWFLRLDSCEQKLLKSVMNQKKTLADIFSFVPSRLRTLPLLANAAWHHLSILSPEGVLLKRFPPRMRSSHFASRDVREEPSEITDLYSERNIRLIKNQSDNKTLLVQTLISPVWCMDQYIPDLFLDGERCKAIKRLRLQEGVVLSTNHPFNLAKKIMYTSANDPSCLEIVAETNKYLSGHAIANRFESLSSTESDFLSQGACLSVRFTKDEYNYKRKLFSRLISLVESYPLFRHTQTFDEFQIMVKNAWQEALELRQASLIFNKNPDSTDNKDLLIEAFTHHSKLFEREDSLPVFIHHAFLASSHRFNRDMVDASQRYGELAQLLCEYEHHTLNSPWFSAVGNDCYGRELWHSSLENLLVLYQDGVPTGSCVSGKDRKAIELIHTDAMLLFRDYYGYWPSINDTGKKRERFVAIFDHLYTAWHQHNHSGQNAPSSAGIKTPANYLPGDIAQAICKSRGPDTLKHDDIIATNNEVERIGDSQQRIKYGYTPCLIASQKMSDKKRLELLTQLGIIVGEEDFWKAQTSFNYNLFSPSLPEGVQQFKRVLEQNDPPLELLANIYYELSRRPKESSDKSSSSAGYAAFNLLSKSWRSSATNNLYAILQEFYESNQPDNLLVEGLAKLVALTEDIFRYNRESRSSPVSPCASPPLPSIGTASMN